MDRVTVADLIEKYRDTVVVTKASRVVETYVLNAMLRQSFSRLRMSEITPAVFCAYSDRRLKMVKPVTVQRELSLLQHLLDIARREWGLPIYENPLRDVSKPKLGGARDRRLQVGEQERLLDACGACRNHLMAPLIQLALETGMRLGELTSIEWNHVELTRSTLYVPETKNGHPRTVPLSSTAMTILRGLETHDMDQVFPLSREAVKQSWQRLIRRAGIDDLHFHDLRHEAITRLFEKGLSVPEVALISGHRDYRMLFRYTHLRAVDLVKKL